MVTAKQITNAAWVGFVYDMVGDPMKYTFKDIGQPPQEGRSHLTPILAAKVVLMSPSERVTYFEREFNKLDTIELDAFKYYVGHGTFIGYVDSDTLLGI